MELNKILLGDVMETLKTIPDESVDCVITSPPYYGLRDYGMDGQIGQEATPNDFVAKLVDLFKEVKRVLKDNGTVWLNLGDSYVGGGFGTSKDENYDMGKQGTNRGTADFETRKKLGALKKKVDGLKTKDLIGIPWRVAFALQADGWYLRQDIIWAKPNPMPESVTDRCTKSHEYIFLLSKNKDYYFDNEAIQEIATGYDGRKDTVHKGSMKYANGDYLSNGNANSLAVKGRERWKYKNLQEDGQSPNSIHEKRLVGEEYLSPVRNKRDVWTVSTKSFSEAHFATFPEDLIVPMVKAGCPKNGVVLDPFMGAGTTGLVAKKLGRNYLGCELNPEYIKIAEERLRITKPMF